MSLSEPLFSPIRAAPAEALTPRRAEERAGASEDDMSFSELLEDEETSEEVVQRPRPHDTQPTTSVSGSLSAETALRLASLSDETFTSETTPADESTGGVPPVIAATPAASLASTPLSALGLQASGGLQALLVEAAPGAPTIADGGPPAGGPGAARAGANLSDGKTEESGETTVTGSSGDPKTPTGSTSLSKDPANAGQTGASGSTPAPSTASPASQAGLTASVDPGALGAPSATGSPGLNAAGSTAGAQTIGAGAPAPSAPGHPALAQAPSATVQVYVRFVERFDGRAQQFNIRLDPAELGRVDVRIEIGADQKVHAVLAAHDSAALSDLARGSKALEQALTASGVDLADGGLRFELSEDRDNRAGSGGGPANEFSERRSPQPFDRVRMREEPTDIGAIQQAAPGLLYSWRPARLNLLA